MSTPPNVGNQIDAVAKPKVALNLPLWVYAAALAAANAIGVFFRV
jgi:hypothetical protein